MMNISSKLGRVRGFTLVEVIVVIVITGIVGGIVAVFLRHPVQNYVDSAGRADLTDTADTAVRRMAREIRLAVPNSVRRSSDIGLEFVPTKTGGRYLSASDNPPAANPYLNFNNSALRDFTVIGNMPTGRQAIVGGDFIVVLNLGAGTDISDVYSAASLNRAAVSSVNGKVVTLATNPFASQNPPMEHPLFRFLVATTPVSFRCEGGFLYRYSNYGWNATQESPPDPAGTRTILASNVESCKFEYILNGNTNSALLGLTLVLKKGNDEPITLTQQIHVDNNP